MSRIEDALKRAGTEGRREQTEPRRGDLHAVETPVVPSWQLDRLPAETTEPERLVAPAAVNVSPVAVPKEPALQPEAPPRYRARGLSPLFAEKLVVGGTGAQASREQYRRLAATLHQNQQQDPGLRVLMIVSAAPGEGKTLTAANLALTLSESYGKKVLLVDADLRKPTLHDLFQVSNAKGLVDGLKAEASVGLPLIEFSSNLQVLPAGEPQSDPMSLLISPPQPPGPRRGGRVIRLGHRRYAPGRVRARCPFAGRDGACGGPRCARRPNPS